MNAGSECQSHIYISVGSLHSWLAKVLVNEQMTPEDYERLVSTFAQQTTETSPIAGEIFKGLAVFLNRKSDPTRPPEVDVVINSFINPSCGEGRADIIRRSAVFELHELQGALSTMPDTSVAESAMIFMRGYQPPECLTRIGATCHINQFFFVRHLEHLWSFMSPSLFCFPGLPSGSCNTLRLKFVTLGRHEEQPAWCDSPQIKELHAKRETEMGKYQLDLTMEHKIKPGNSIVRNFNAHSNRYFSIEQYVTVTVQAKGAGWLGTEGIVEPLSAVLIL